jgi:hypothetical protein
MDGEELVMSGIGQPGGELVWCHFHVHVLFVLDCIYTYGDLSEAWEFGVELSGGELGLLDY